MPNKHGLMDTLKHLAFEEEPEKQGLETAPGAGSSVAHAATAAEDSVPDRFRRN